MTNLKIYDLHTTDSEMHQLPDDEVRNIVGGCPGNPHDDKRCTHTASKFNVPLVSLPCPGDPHDD